MENKRQKVHQYAPTWLPLSGVVEGDCVGTRAEEGQQGWTERLVAGGPGVDWERQGGEGGETWREGMVTNLNSQRHPAKLDPDGFDPPASEGNSETQKLRKRRRASAHEISDQDR